VTVIKGKLCKGFGEAKKCLPSQIKFFKEKLPEITSMYSDGTLNVDLENPIRFLRYECVFPKLKWDENRPAEDIAFVKASILPQSDRFKNPVPCLLYFAETSSHRLNPFMLEIITEKLDLAGVKECSVFLASLYERRSGISLESPTVVQRVSLSTIRVN
jgi:CTP-dependent riboflavin kinase